MVLLSLQMHVTESKLCLLMFANNEIVLMKYMKHQKKSEQ